MPNRLTKEDLADVDIVDAVELLSDGSATYNYRTGVSVTSTTSGINRVVVSGGLILLPDTPLQVGDKAILTGTSGGLGDGTFTVAAIISDTTFDVAEAIGTSTGGSADFRHPAGAKSVGVDSTLIASSTSNILQKVLEDLDASISSGGITEPQHEALDRLTHQINETSYDEALYTGSRLDSLTTWTSAAKILKIREEFFTYTGNKVTTIVTNQYDGAGVLKETNTEVLAYTGNVYNTTTRTHV